MTDVLTEIMREIVGLTERELLGRGRESKASVARHLLWLYLRKECRWTHDRIGRAFGRHHATIISGIRHAENYLVTPGYEYERILYTQFKEKLRMGRTEYIIAIDPDVSESGVAVLHVPSRTVKKVGAMSFVELIDFLDSERRDMTELGLDVKRITVLIEDSDNRTNWNLPGRCNPRAAAAIGHGIGMCHGTQRHIQEFAEARGFSVVLQKPLRKTWAGRNGKITQNEITRFITGLPKRMNQECRDACLLAWCYADLPIHIPTKQL